LLKPGFTELKLFFVYIGFLLSFTILEGLFSLDTGMRLKKHKYFAIRHLKNLLPFRVHPEPHLPAIMDSAILQSAIH
jgi:hypothetical protein